MKTINCFLIALVLGVWTSRVSAVPITDTVFVDGTEWAQVDLFDSPSWNDINAVCPGGVCGGTLDGNDMTGWTWATVDDVNALFNHYLGGAELGPGPDAQVIDHYVGMVNFFKPFGDWNLSFEVLLLGATVGLMQDSTTTFGAMIDDGDFSARTASTIIDINDPIANALGYGGWFHRGSNPQISVPGTLALFGLGLATLVRTRRKIA